MARCFPPMPSPTVVPSVHVNVAMTKLNEIQTQIGENTFEYLKPEFWAGLVKCLLEDDVERLKRFRENSFPTDATTWRSFLRSFDLQSKFSRCSVTDNDGISTAAAASLSKSKYNDAHAHLQVTCPFLMAFSMGAEKCFTFMLSTYGDDAIKITENGLNALHSIVIGLHMKLMNISTAMTLMRALKAKDIIPTDDIQQLLKKTSNIGLTPMELAIFLGYPQIADIISYRSNLLAARSHIEGLYEHCEADVTQYQLNSEHTRFYVSPLCILLDRYGFTNCDELRQTEVFRRGFFIKEWAEALYAKNRLLYCVLLCERVLTVILSCVINTAEKAFGSKSSLVCDGSGTFEFSGGVLLFFYILITSILSIITSLFCLLDREKHLRAANYPKRPRKMYISIFSWVIAHIFVVITTAVLIILSFNHHKFCSQENTGNIQMVYSMITTFNILVLVYLAGCQLQIVPYIGKFVINFYSSFQQFAQFVFFYLILIGLFTRVFLTSEGFVIINKKIEKEANHTIEFNLVSGVYNTFLLSLNIVKTAFIDATKFSSDLQIIHIVYVLMVPCLFLNFIIGVLTTRLGEVAKFEEEIFQMSRLFVAVWSESVLFNLRRFFRMKASNELCKITLCKPVQLRSKAFTFLEHELI